MIGMCPSGICLVCSIETLGEKNRSNNFFYGSKDGLCVCACMCVNVCVGVGGGAVQARYFKFYCGVIHLIQLYIFYTSFSNLELMLRSQGIR